MLESLAIFSTQESVKIDHRQGFVYREVPGTLFISLSFSHQTLNMSVYMNR